VRNDKPAAAQKSRERLRSFVKEKLCRIREENGKLRGGIPTFEAPDPFCFYMAGAGIM